jgi:two-component system, OmpR family, sensor histidine kinase BaeS
MSRPRSSSPRAGLAARLLAIQVLVALTAVLTAWVVALLVGPPLFHEHLLRASAAHAEDQTAHAEDAFASATAISLSIALLAAGLTALMASWYTTRRIGRPVVLVAEAAAEIAAGRYDARVAPAGLGPEFDAMADSFNQMASRLSSVETTRRRLLSDLAHEMRTPVATIGAYLEGIEDGVTPADGSAWAVLREQTHRLSRLAEDISAVSRAEEHQLPLSLRPVHPVDLVSDAVQAAGARFENKGVSLSTTVPTGLPVIEGDPDRLGQVLANLLDNALRMTPTGGGVTVSAGSTPGGVQIEVSDTGAGIAAEHVDHLFERFYRVDTARDRTHGGSGIGLAISKALVEAHGGRVSAHSPGPGHGATFRVWLPTAG